MRSVAWRSELRRYLTEHINQPVSIGETYDAIAELMPVHTAARAWSRNARGNSRPLVSPGRMRWHLLVKTLHYFDVTLAKPPRGQRATLPRSTMIMVNASACAVCNKPFVSIEGSAVCSRRCSLVVARAVGRDLKLERQSQSHSQQDVAQI